MLKADAYWSVSWQDDSRPSINKPTSWQLDKLWQSWLRFYGRNPVRRAVKIFFASLFAAIRISKPWSNDGKIIIPSLQEERNLTTLKIDMSCWPCSTHRHPYAFSAYERLRIVLYARSVNLTRPTHSISDAAMKLISLIIISRSLLTFYLFLLLYSLLGKCTEDIRTIFRKAILQRGLRISGPFTRKVATGFLQGKFHSWVHKVTLALSFVD